MTPLIILWSLTTTVVLCLWEAAPAHVAMEAVGVGVLACGLLGVVAGWRRQLGVLAMAPAVSWFTSWLPLWIAAIVRHGVVKGLVTGFVLISVGWFLIAAMELVAMGIPALIVRALRGVDRRASVIIDPPRGESNNGRFY